MMMPPIQPPKPRIALIHDGAILDTGHADVIHDSWPDAIAHAERIRCDYKARLVVWALQGRDDHDERSEQ
jgi:hypothetical protein